MYSFEEETHMNNPKIPQYGIVSNIQYMTGLAVRICKSVLILAVVQITLGVLMNLLELFVAPAILRAIEEGASLTVLLAVIAFFSLGIIFTGTAADYVNMNVIFGRVSIRSAKAPIPIRKTLIFSRDTGRRTPVPRETASARKLSGTPL